MKKLHLSFLLICAACTLKHKQIILEDNKPPEMTVAVKSGSCMIQLGEHSLNNGGSSAKNDAYCMSDRSCEN